MNLSPRQKMLARAEENWEAVKSATTPEELIGLIYLPSGGMSDKPVIGTRTLIARTCHKCGCLKMSNRFRREAGTGYWSSKCKDCSVQDMHGIRADTERVQGETLDKAVKRYEPYTGADLEVIARDDLSIRQKAELLGRSYYGVATMLKKYRAGNNPTVRRLTEGHPL